MRFPRWAQAAGLIAVSIGVVWGLGAVAERNERFAEMRSLLFWTGVKLHFVLGAAALLGSVILFAATCRWPMLLACGTQVLLYLLPPLLFVFMLLLACGSCDCLHGCHQTDDAGSGGPWIPAALTLADIAVFWIMQFRLWRAASR